MIGRFKMRLHPPPGCKLIRDWNGQRVRTTKPLVNGNGEIPVGSLATVRTAGGTGLQLKLDPCPHCGVAFFISRVPDTDVEVV